MEAMGAAAPIAALIETVAKITSVCVKYSLAVKHSKEEISRLQDEVQDLEQVLKNAHEVYKTLEETGQVTEASTDQYLTKCKTQLSEIATKLEPTSISRLASRLKFDQLAWPLRKKEVDILIRSLESTKQSISLSIQVDQLKRIDSVHSVVQSSNAICLPIASGTSFDSFSDQLNSRCYAGTRMTLRQSIRDWFEDPDGACIFWLCGMAGEGKSTILRSMAQEFQDKQQLGATFFFKRGEGSCGDASRFFTTIANQLMQNLPELGVFIKEACKMYPDVHDKTLEQQFRRLIKNPMAKYEAATHFPILIVVDALDECNEEAHARSIIELLANLRPAAKNGVRILLSSRPETPIRMTFRNLTDTTYVSCILHEFSDDVGHDIEVYLRKEFSDIRKNSIYELAADWPTEKQIKKLVKMAEGIFIAAATICRTVGHTGLDPQEQIDLLLSYSGTDQFRPLDIIYQSVLDRMLFRLNGSQRLSLLADFQNVVGTIILLEDTLSSTALSALLSVPKQFIASRLSMLHSVLWIPTQDDQAIRLLHLSFRDFLTCNAVKDNMFWIDTSQTHERIGQNCLRLLLSSPTLKEDICDIGKPDTRRRAIDEATISAKIMPEVRYACLYWIGHICNSHSRSLNQQIIYEFLKNKFLYWVEALTLLGYQSKIKDMLAALQTHCQDSDNLGLIKFLADAIELISNFGNMIDTLPLQLYSSALVFTSTQSVIRTIFEHEIKPWIKDIPKPVDLYASSSSIHANHTDVITSVALSPDNKQFASGYADRSIKLWTTMTGNLECTLRGYGKSIELLGYLQQNTHLLSCSHACHNTITIWNSKTGRIERVIEFESNIQKANLSHNSRLLAVCLKKGPPELWDLSIFERKHITPVREVATCTQFSIDDEMLGLAFHDRIEVLATTDGKLVSVLKRVDGDPGCRKLAFCPTGDLLAVATYFDTIRIWSIKNRLLVSTITTGNTDDIMFLPNSSLLICLSLWLQQCTVFWDYVNNRLDTSYLGYRNPVGLSNDRTRLALVSMGGRVTVQNTSTTIVEQSFDISQSSFRKMLLLDNTRHLMIQGYNAIELWDMNLSKRIYSIKTSVTTVSSVLLSPNSEYLASQTDDGVVAVWSTSSASLIRKSAGHSCLGRFSKGSTQITVLKTDSIELWNLLARSSSVVIPNPECLAYWEMEYVFDDRFLLGYAKNDTVSIWDTESAEKIHEFRLAQSPFPGKMAISPNYRYMALYLGSGYELRSLPTGTRLSFLTSSRSPINYLLFSPSGEHILIHDHSENLRLWDIGANCVEWTSTLDGWISHAAFCDNGKQILVHPSSFEKVYLFDAISGTHIRSLKCEGRIEEIYLSEDQQYLKTNKGTLSLKQPGSQNSIPRHIFRKKTLEETWMTVNGESMLCVPNLYQPTCSTTQGDILAMGYTSGEIVLYNIVSGTSRSLLHERATDLSQTNTSNHQSLTTNSSA